MNAIKGLILKDVLNLKSYKRTLLFLVVLYAIMGIYNENILTFIPVFFPLCLGMAGISSFSYDNIAKSDAYILALPTTKKHIVRSRYLYISLMTLLGVVLGITTCIALQYFRNTTLIEIEEIIYSSIGALIGMTLLQAFQLPIIYKYGIEKGRLIQMIIVLLVVLGATAFMIESTISIPNEMIDILAQYGFAIAIIITLTLYAISYKISVGIYSKKEI